MEKTILSCAFFAAFMGMGLVQSSLGPVTLILMDRLDVGIGGMGYITASRSLGYLCGCCLAGPAYDNRPARGNKLMSAGLFFTGVFQAAIPLVYDAATMAAMLLLQGVAIGYLDTGGNVLLIRLHGDKVRLPNKPHPTTTPPRCYPVLAPRGTDTVGRIDHRWGRGCRLCISSSPWALWRPRC